MAVERRGFRKRMEETGAGPATGTCGPMAWPTAGDTAKFAGLVRESKVTMDREPRRDLAPGRPRGGGAA